MYAVGDVLPIDTVDPGSTLLLVGPPMTGKRTLATRLLTAGLDDGEAVAMVAADGSARDVRGTLTDGFGKSVEEYPVGVIDCAGESHDRELTHPLDSRVGSPADLTGIGMELMTLLEGLYTDHSQRIRVGIDSLTTMSMYADPEQVVRFFHVFSNRVTEIDGFGIAVAHSETVDDEFLTQCRSFVDGVVEVREAGQGRRELRVLGLGTGGTDWMPVEQTVERHNGSSRQRRQPASRGETATSLRAIADDVREDGPTLTLLDPVDEQAVSTVERYFDRHNVAVRRASTDGAGPNSVALLHRGDDLLASENLLALRNAIEIDEDGTDVFGARRTSDLLSRLDGSVFGTGETDKDLLIDVSHNIELLAARTGDGRLHAGFQAFSRLVDDPQSRQIYQRLADAGVEIHLYGAPDVTVPIDGLTLHGGTDPELTDSWFVVFDGAGDPEMKGALLSFELDEPNTYRGFWTYDEAIVDRIDQYLTGSYVERGGRAELSGD
jgi:KaiC/GvpD/RAD55 family RecA-like ATPase